MKIILKTGMKSYIVTKDNLKLVILIEKGEGYNREYVKRILRNVKGVVRLTNSNVSPYTNHTALEIIVKDRDSAKAVVKKLKDEAGIDYVQAKNFVKESEYHLYYAEGGDVEEEEYDPEKDLFNDYDNIPAELKAVLEKYEDEYADGATYELNNKVLAEIEPLGYTFDYYLDAEPYNLRKILKRGGVIGSLLSLLNEPTSLDDFFK